MTERAHVNVLVGILLVLGFGLFAYKLWIAELPLLPKGQSNVWTLEAQVAFQVDKGPVKVSLWLPPSRQDFALLKEHFISNNFSVTQTQDQENRQAVWAIRRAVGKQILYYRAMVYQNPARKDALPVKAPEYPKAFTLDEAESVAANVLLEAVRAKSADSLSFSAQLLKQLQSKDDPNSVALMKSNYTKENLARVAVSVLAGAHIPARMVHGFKLDTHNNVHKDVLLTTWLEVWNGKNWLYLHPKTAETGTPQNLFVWYYGDNPPITINEGMQATVRFGMLSHLEDALDIAKNRARHQDSRVIDFSLMSLPVRTQQVYKILLMVPVGALVILLLRTFVGVLTFGTFMPVLIALALRETELLWGCFLFSLVVSLGLAMRFYLDNLKLLLVPRLASILTFVVILMMLISILSNKLGLSYGVSVALFPMVIITMTIERMSIVWEERSAVEAIQQGIGSLLSAAVAYLIMFNQYSEHLFFVFPELLLILMAIMLGLGRYRGYRLIEFYRFRELRT